MFKNKISKQLHNHNKTLAMLFIAALIAGCSSGTERFSDSFYSSAMPTSTDNGNAGQIYQTNQTVNGAVVSNQLPPPPAQPNYQQSQSYPVQNTVNGQIMGAPPQNLGTIPASEANNIARPITVETHYTVQAGDTLYNISRRAGVSVDAIRNANNIQNGVINIGQILTIPGVNSVANQSPNSESPAVSVANNTTSKNITVKQPTQKVETPKVTVNQPQTSTSQNNQVASIAPQATGIDKMRWPVQGRILSSFGQNQGNGVNDGIDIMVPEGTSVRAAENGVVIDAVEGLKKYGNTVLIRHENNIVTVYAYNSKVFVKRGQSVRRGDEIAKSGMSGDAATPRVHFEVRKNAAPVNPIDYLEN